jgi:hypothetical protein
MIINDIYEVFVFVNGCEILDSRIATNLNAAIKEDLYTGFPICKLSFCSTLLFLNTAAIVDGTPVTFKIESSVWNLKETLNFRVSSVTTTGVGGNFLYVLECYLDFYEIFRDPNKYAIRGTSSEVFKNVAKINNLVSLIDPTNDIQLWVPSETNLGEWLNYIMNYGWADFQSCMIWFMNRKKELFYKNLDSLFYESKNKKIFQYGNLKINDFENKIYRYKSISYKMTSGQENIFNRGYDGRNYHFDLLSNSHKTDNANKVRAITEIVNINKELSQGLEENMLEIDTGNFHPHYHMAATQNLRIRSSLSTYTLLACEYYLPIRIGEIVFLNPTSNGNAGTYMESLNCKYIISSIETIISESSLHMNVELCTQGFNGHSTQSY